MNTNNPVTTIIKSRTEDMTAYWVEPSAICIAAGETVEVPFDVWSRANRKHQEAIIALTQSKKIELTLRILGTDGVLHEIPFAPYLAMEQKERTVLAHIVRPGPVAEAPALPEISAEPVAELPAEPPAPRLHAPNVSADGFTIIASGKGAEAMRQRGIRSECPIPQADGVSDFRDVPTESLKEPAGIKIVNGRAEPKPEEDNKVIKEAGETPAVESAPKISDEETTVRVGFAKAVSEKRWDAAMAILTGAFGSELHFNKKAVIAMKDLDAIIKKYNLVWKLS